MKQSHEVEASNDKQESSKARVPLKAICGFVLSARHGLLRSLLPHFSQALLEHTNVVSSRGRQATRPGQPQMVRWFC